MPTARGRRHNPGVGFEGEEDYEAGDWSAVDSLLGPVIKSVIWPEIGASVSGTVLSLKSALQTNLDGEVRTYENGDIRMQVIVTLQTDEVEDDDDDGVRKLYIRGAMVKSVRAEMARNKVRGLRPGGHLTVTYIEDGPAQKGKNPAKLFSVAYEPPAS